MIELPYVSSQSVEFVESYTFATTAEGRVVAQAKQPSPRRSWNLSATRYLAQAQGTLMAFVNGEWGKGPFFWVSSDAQVLNMLSPAAASCDPSEVVLGTSALLLGTPPMQLPDGSWAGRSYAKNTINSVFFGGRVPVIPGKMVTASAYVTGAGGGVSIQWYDATGSSLTKTNSTVLSTSTSVVRSYVRATPPVGAVSARVATNAEATQACRPALTWTSELFDWADGQGCPKAVVSTASKDVQSAHYDPRGFRAANMTFTVREVG